MAANGSTSRVHSFLATARSAPRIQQHEAALLNHAHQLLAGVNGLQILGPAPERKGGIVSFVIEGMNPGDLSVLLDQQGMAIRAGHHCAMPLHKRLGIASSCRASFYFYNTLADIERFVEILEKTRQTFGLGVGRTDR